MGVLRTSSPPLPRNRASRGIQHPKKWDAACPEGAFVVTSNVDGQFQKSGFSEKNVWEIHGSIHQLQCTEPCAHTIWPATELYPEIDETVLEMTSPLPHCSRCGALARPNILMFNDFAWVKRRATAQRLRFDEWLQNIERVVVIELGAGTAIPSIREMGQRLVKRVNGTLIRINPREPEVDREQDIGIKCGALEGLRLIDTEIAGLHKLSA